jgi:uncharacterized protein YecT (DUF1311 family)
VAPDREPDPSASREDDAVEILTFDFIPGYARPRARRGLHFRAPKWADRDSRRRWSTPRPRHIALGLVLAVIGGAMVGLWAKPDLVARRGGNPSAPPQTNAVNQDRLDIAVRPPAALIPVGASPVQRATQTAPPASETIVERPTQTASVAAREPAPPKATRAIAEQPVGMSAPSTSAARDARAIQSTALPAPPVQPAIRRSAPPPEESYADADQGPSFDCRYARSRAEDMVCADAGLAQADRVLERSYERAVAFGVPRRMLRDEQDDWLAIRENAARYSRSAVADVYRQRIRELNAMADGRVE